MKATSSIVKHTGMTMKLLKPKKTTAVNLRLDEPSEKLMRRAAIKSGHDSLSAWIRKTAIEAAKRELAK